MESWNDYKKTIKSISNEEKIWIELLADIVTARNDKGITQRELEELSGLQQPSIARMENPTQDSFPNVLTIIKYLDVIGMKLKIVSKDEN